MAYTSINPANGKLIQSFQEHDDSQVDAALASAEKAFLSWSKESLRPERRSCPKPHNSCAIGLKTCRGR